MGHQPLVRCGHLPLSRRWHLLGTVLLCVALLVSILPPLPLSQAAPPAPQAELPRQATDSLAPTPLPAPGGLPELDIGHEKELPVLLDLDPLPLHIDSRKAPSLPSSPLIATSAADVASPAEKQPPVPGVQLLDAPTTAAEAAQRGWRAIEVKPPEAPDDIVKYYPNELPRPKTEVRPARPEIAALAPAETPRLQVSPEYLNFAQSAAGLLPVTQTLQIRSITGTVNFDVAEAIPWLATSPTSGAAGTAAVPIVISVNTAGLTAAGSPYTGTLIVANQNDPDDMWRVHVRLTITDAYATSTLYSFDAEGNLQRRVRPDGGIVDYEYDAVGRLTAVRYPDGSAVIYTYDAAGNRTTMTDGRGTTVYQYDADGRLAAVYNPGLNPVRYAYDLAGALTRLTYPDGRIMAYTYDADGRMLSAGNGTYTTTYQYDPTTGYLATQTLPNGITTSYTYDADGRLTSVTHRDASAVLLMAFHYTLDANGHRTAVTKQTPSGSEATTYTYDDLLRLARVVYGDGQQTDYAYDPLGNRTAMTVTAGAAVTVTNYIYDADNRLLQAGDEVFQYDANGNVIRRASPQRTIEYSYDSRNLLTRYSDGMHVVQFEYDGDGNRVAKIVDGVHTNYFNDVSSALSQVLMETDANWSVQRVYSYGLDRLGVESTGTGKQYYLYDSPVRSVAALANAAGTLASRYDYDVFGARLALTAGDTNRFLYNGEQYDAEIGLIFLRNRYYDPQLGRFISRDPSSGKIQDPQTTSPYSYVSNNPVNLVDPLGLEVGEPGFWESLIPVWGSGRAAINDFQTGHWGWGLFNTAMAASDVFLVKSLVTKGGPLAWKLGSNTWSATRKWIGKNDILGKLAKGENVHHWLVTQGSWLGKKLPNLFNQPWNLKAVSPEIHTAIHNTADVLSKWWLETPTWAKNAETWLLGRGLNQMKDNGDLGGVSLNKTAELMLAIDDITGGVYDPATGQIVLYGRQDVALPPMDTDDLAVAVNSVFGGQDPGVSIDPPLVNGQYSVRYEGQTRRTEFGWIMFESDRVMKTLALGKDNNPPGLPVTSNVPGYKSMLQRELESGTCTPGLTNNRFWFQPSEVRLVRSADGKSMVFDTVRMEVLTESKFQDNVVGDPEAEAFAAHFTQHYDEFAEQFPILKDLKRLGKVVAVIKWIKDNNIPVDLSFIQDYNIEYFSTPDNTPSTTVQGSSGVCQITITGGVTYRPPNEYLSDDPVDPVTDAMRDAALGQRPVETDFQWDFRPPAQVLTKARARGLLAADDESLTAVAQSFARSRKDGNVVFAEVDLSYPVSGTFTLNLTRYYDSFGDKPGDFGYGWQARPYGLRFPAGKQRFTFGPDNIAIDLYARLWLADRGAGREDEYVLLGLDSLNWPIYRRAGSMDLLRQMPDGTFQRSGSDLSVIAFAADGRVIVVADSNGNLLQYAYDGAGRLTRIQGPGDRAIDLSYNAEGRVSQASGPGGRTISYGYDAAGNLTTVTDPAGHARAYTYDGEHRLTGATDAGGNPALSAAGYDDYNRPADRTAGAAADYSYSFDLTGRQTDVIGPNGEQTQQRFDGQYRLTEQTDPLGNRTRIAYEGGFGPKAITDTHGAVTQMAYDVRGNLAVVLDGAGGRTDLYYDARDRLIASRDPVGVATGFGYDDRNNLTKIYHNVVLVLDENGNLTSFYYNPNNITSFTYGAAGSLDAASNPLGSQSQFAYDANGQLVGAATPTGLDTTFNYDSRSRLTGVQSAGGQASFGYDAADNLTNVATNAGSVALDYDAAGRLTGLTDAESHDTSFAYDADGNLTQVQDAADQSTSYSYDVLGRLQTAALPNGTANAYGYDELGRLVASQSGLGGATPRLAVVPAALHFGDVQLGGSRTLTITLFNLGRAALSVTAVTTSTPFAAAFVGPAVIQPRGLLAVPITFTPADIGPAAANLTIQSNDTVSPTLVAPMTGEGALKVTNLRAIAVDKGIQLVWDVYADGGVRSFGHFNIYRSTTPIPNNVAGLTPLDQSLTDRNATSFTDTTATPGTPYYYAVTAVYADGFEYRRVNPVGPIAYYTAFDRVGGFISVAAATQHEYRPAVAFNSTAAEYLVVYERDASGTGANLDVLAQRVAADGALLGEPIAVATTSVHERRPRVAYNSVANEYLVVFEYDYYGNGSDFDIRGQRVAGNGSLLGGNVFTARITRPEYYPDVAFCPAANQYLVVFEFDSNGDGSDFDVAGWRVAGGGASVGNPFYVGGLSVGGNPVHEWQPHVACNTATSQYLVVFDLDYYDDGSDYGIYAMLVNAAGSRTGPYGVSNYIGYDERNARLTYNPAVNEFFVVFDFSTNNGDIVGRRLTGSAGQIGSPFYILTTTRADRRPDVALNSSSNDYAVAVEYDYAGDGASDWDIIGQRISASGAYIGKAYFVGGLTARNEYRPAITYNPAANEFLVAWEHDFAGNGSDWDIWAQRLGAERPVLQVTPASLNFGSTATGLSLTIANLGTGALDWYVIADQPWLAVWPYTGRTTTATGIIGLVNRSGLAPATYTASLRVLSDGGNLTVPVTMTVPNAPPAPPQAPIPPDGAAEQASAGADLGLTLGWQSADGNGDPVTYDLYFSADQALVAGRDQSVRRGQGLTTPAFRPTSLDFLTTYYWLVVAYDNRGANTIGPVWRFTTAAVLAPQLVPLTPDPTNNARPDFAWDAVTGAARYHIQIDDDPAFGSPVVSVDNLTAPSYALVTDLREGLFYWRVCSIDAQGRPGSFSPADEFEIDRTPPAAPSLVPVQPERTRNTRPEFAWNAVAGASGYRLQVAGNAAFSPALLDSTTATTSYIPESDLPEGEIFWRVSSRDAAGNQSAFSAADQFVVDVTPPPTVSGLAAEGQSELVRLSWSPLAAPADFAHFNVYRSETPFANVSGLTPLDSSLTFSPTTAFSDATAVYGAVYYYAVTAADVAGNENKAVQAAAGRRFPPVFTAAQPIAPGDAPVVSFGDADVTLDFAHGPGGNVTVTAHNTAYPDPPAGVALLPKYWDITADFGAGFAVDITIRYYESDYNGFRESEIIGVAYWDAANQRWDYIAGSVDMTANTVTLFGVTHFSTWVLLASTPPKPPTGLTIQRSGGSPQLAWESVTQDIRGNSLAGPGYRIYRSTSDPYFQCDDSSLLAEMSATSYTDTGAANATAYYVVQAVDASGRRSATTRRVGSFVVTLVPGW